MSICPGSHPDTRTLHRQHLPTIAPGRAPVQKVAPSQAPSRLTRTNVRSMFHSLRQPCAALQLENRIKTRRTSREPILCPARHENPARNEKGRGSAPDYARHHPSPPATRQMQKQRRKCHLQPSKTARNSEKQQNGFGRSVIFHQPRWPGQASPDSDEGNARPIRASYPRKSACEAEHPGTDSAGVFHQSASHHKGTIDAQDRVRTSSGCISRRALSRQ